MHVASSISAASAISIPASREGNSSSPHSFSTQHSSIAANVSAPRKRARPLRHTLTTSNVRLIKQAIAHAEAIGLALNVMVTIDWDLCGIDPHGGRSHWLHLFYNWIRSRNCRTGFVWVMEGGGKLGIHSHILLHVPRALRADFRKRQRAWRKAAGIPWKAGVMKINPIGQRADPIQQGFPPQCARGDLQRVTEYILKDADATARRLFDLQRDPRYCAIAGKRCGTSRNLGSSAIKKWQHS